MHVLILMAASILGAYERQSLTMLPRLCLLARIPRLGTCHSVIGMDTAFELQCF